MELLMPCVFSQKLRFWLEGQPVKKDRQLLLDSPESDQDDQIIAWAKIGHLPILTEKQTNKVFESSFEEYRGSVKYLIAPEPVVILPVPKWVVPAWPDDDQQRACSVWMFESEAIEWLEEFRPKLM